MKKICILDFKNGNIGSIKNSLEKLNIVYNISNSNELIESASHLILPGVGSFSHVMDRLNEFIDIKFLTKQVLFLNKPILGICVGMQILSTKGCENNIYSNGLNYIEGEVKKIKTNLPLPHVGWNNIKIISKNFLLNGIENGTDFYFTHSYSFKTTNTKNIMSTTFYDDEFSSIIYEKNIIGVQFHPEKSQTAGLKILKNFYEYYE